MKWIGIGVLVIGIVMASCSTYKGCEDCTKKPECEWCLTSQSCTPINTCLYGYKVCCVTYYDCDECLSHAGCGYCDGSGCMPGNETSVDPHYTCEKGDWKPHHCPDQSQPFPYVVVVFGIICMVGTFIATGFLCMVILFVRWQIAKQRAVNRLFQMQAKLNEGQDKDPKAYASLAKLIRKEQKRPGNDPTYDSVRLTYLMD